MPLSDAINYLQSAPQRVHSAIANAASKTGVDFDFLVREAKIESGLNPQARARTSSATGLFQFTKQTWLSALKQHGVDHNLGWAADAITRGSDGQYSVADPGLRARILELRAQPEAAAAMAAELASDHHGFLSEKLGRPPEAVDLYLAHFLGEAGAARFLDGHDANPEGAAASLLPAAAQANRSVFYRPDGTARSFAEIRGNFAEKLGGAATAPPRIQSAAQYALAPFSPRRSPGLGLPGGETDTPKLRSIEPMPQRLSLDFARDAYRRLAAMNGAS
ncbi:MAG: transglycosylase SLT domain-containing protein [Pseudomonadota bacterium]